MIKTEIKKLELSKLTSFPNNPQIVSEKTMHKITRAMKKDGWYGELCLIWENENKQYIISGKHRIKCAINAGIAEKECIIIIDEKYNWEKAKKDVLKFNSLHGDFEGELLNEFISNIAKEHDADIDELLEETDIKKELLDELLKEETTIKKEILKPYEKTHILISFPPEKIMEITEQLDKISLIEGIEIEQSSN